MGGPYAWHLVWGRPYTWHLVWGGGVLGRAQKMYGMVVHLAVVLSNHCHLLLAPEDAEQLAKFTFVNSNVAREAIDLFSFATSARYIIQN